MKEGHGWKWWNFELLHLTRGNDKSADNQFIATTNTNTNTKQIQVQIQCNDEDEILGGGNLWNWELLLLLGSAGVCRQMVNSLQSQTSANTNINTITHTQIDQCTNMNMQMLESTNNLITELSWSWERIAAAKMVNSMQSWKKASTNKNTPSHNQHTDTQIIHISVCQFLTVG